jgi:hypothetical protein
MSNRIKILLSMIQDDYIGCELGVADGTFSAQILGHSTIQYLYSIDMWAGDRGHNDAQYTKAVNQLLPYKDKNTIIKYRFDEAVSLFDDNFFDFIYIDGYAHTGQDNGKTLYDWWPKLKHNRIFSGHDYDKSWPKNIEAVDRFATKHNQKINVIEDKPYNSWYIIKGLEQ